MLTSPKPYSGVVGSAGAGREEKAPPVSAQPATAACVYSMQCMVEGCWLSLHTQRCYAHTLHYNGDGLLLGLNPSGGMCQGSTDRYGGDFAGFAGGRVDLN